MGRKPKGTKRGPKPKPPDELAVKFRISLAPGVRDALDLIVRDEEYEGRSPAIADAIMEKAARLRKRAKK